jgi:hypothetical protein
MTGRFSLIIRLGAAFVDRIQLVIAAKALIRIMPGGDGLVACRVLFVGHVHRMTLLPFWGLP